MLLNYLSAGRGALQICQLWEQKMVAKGTSYGLETYKPYLDIEKIINVLSAGSVTWGHVQKPYEHSM